jgi:thiol-disulfide isomerase/thioredoxin
LIAVLLLLLAAPLGAQDAAAPAVAPAPAPAKPALYDEAADGRAQIDAALLRAARENRRVLVQWGGNWCGWCIRLHELCSSDKEIRRKLQYEYDVVHVDIGRWDKHMDLAASYGADLKGNGVPYLTVLAADGSLLANQETGSLEAAGETPGHDAAKVLAFLAQHQAPYRQAADLRAEALAAAARDGRQVFLHFGAPWCGWCGKLEAWMQRPDVAALLARQFVDCKVDVDRTLGGQELLAELSGGQSGGIPWFAFLDGEGRLLATSSGPEGNTGFPVAPAEIAHFRGMLEQAAPRLRPQDVEALVQSLQPPEPPAGG